MFNSITFVSSKMYLIRNFERLRIIIAKHRFRVSKFTFWNTFIEFWTLVNCSRNFFNVFVIVLNFVFNRLSFAFVISRSLKTTNFDSLSQCKTRFDLSVVISCFFCFNKLLAYRFHIVFFFFVFFDVNNNV